MCMFTSWTNNGTAILYVGPHFEVKDQLIKAASHSWSTQEPLTETTV